MRSDQSPAPRAVQPGLLGGRPGPLSEHEIERVHQVLSAHYPEYIDPEIDRQMRDHFPIRLDRADMRPENGRWQPCAEWI